MHCFEYFSRHSGLSVALEVEVNSSDIQLGHYLKAVEAGFVYTWPNNTRRRRISIIRRLGQDLPHRKQTSAHPQRTYI